MTSAGRRYLLAILQIMPAREVALRCHVSEMSVSRWRAGVLVPSPCARRLLELHCGIPAALWTQAVQRPAMRTERH